MKSLTLGLSGVHPSVTWDGAGFRIVWQDDHYIARCRVSFDPVKNGWASSGLSLFDIGGPEGAFPKVHSHQGSTWTAFRQGGSPYLGTVLTADGAFNVGQVHGAFPMVMAGPWLAYISGPKEDGYPVMLRNLVAGGGIQLVRSAAGTGLSRIQLIGGRPIVRTTDEDRTAVRGVVDPAFAEELSIGATDRAGIGPCNVVQDADGRELVLWSGQDSQNPQLATDGAGTFCAVAWSSGREGVRAAVFHRSELTFPVEQVPQTRPVPVDVPRVMAWWYDRGRYGDFPDAPGNSSMLGLEMFASSEGPAPDGEERMRLAAIQRGGIFLAGNEENVVAARSYWHLVRGLWIHEPPTPADARWEAVNLRATVRRLGLSDRPVIAVLYERQLSRDYAGVSDAIAYEVYFAQPAESWAAMYEQAKVRVAEALTLFAPTPVYLCPQAFDRRGNPEYEAWQRHPEQLTAIAQACFEALPDKRVRGVLPFAYARPGGATDYPFLIDVYRAQAALLKAPPLPAKDESSTMNEVYFPSDEQCTNMLQRISISYVDVLKRPEGIFGVPPDGEAVAITKPGGGARLDTKSLAVWLGRYFHRFNEYKGDHERAARSIESDLFNSEEAKAHRPQ